MELPYYHTAATKYTCGLTEENNIFIHIFKRGFWHRGGIFKLINIKPQLN